MTAQKQSSILTQELVDVVLLGRGTVASSGFVSPTYHLHNPAVPAHEYNPDKAKELLDQAGFQDVNGDGLREGQDGQPMNLEILVSSSSSLTIRTAEIISEYLKDVGVSAKTSVMESGMVDTLVPPTGTAWRTATTTCVCGAGATPL